MGLFSCAKPDLPSKKEIIINLGRERESLQAEVSRQRVKLVALEKDTLSYANEKAAWATLRKEYEEALQHKTAATAQLLVKCGRLSGVLESAYGSDAQLGATGRQRRELTVDVTAYDPDGIVLAADAEGATSGVVRGGNKDAATDGETRPEARLEVAFGKVEKLSMALLGRLNTAASDMDRLRASKRASEGKLGCQVQNLELRCAALEQENRGLNELNGDLQSQLDRINQDLSSVQAASQGSTTKLQSELQVKAQQAGTLSQELQAALLMVNGLQQDVADRERQLADLKEEHEASAAEAEALRASLTSREEELRAMQAERSAAEAQLSDTSRAAQAAAAAATLELDRLRGEVDGLRRTLITREAELKEVSSAHETGRAALAAAQAELGSLRRTAADMESQLPGLRDTVRRGDARATATEAELQATRSTLSDVQQQAGRTAIELTTALASLEASRSAVAEAEQRLASAQVASEASERALQDMTNQYVSTKRDLIGTSKQMAGLALEHNKAIESLAAVREELSATQSELRDTRCEAAALEDEMVSSQRRLESMNQAWPALQQELAALKAQHAECARELAGRRALLEAISRLSVKGSRTPQKQSEASLLSYYQAALTGDVVRLKVCDTPLGLCGGLLTSLAESKDMTSLVLDMDCSREPLWEKAGLRAACLAAALSLSSNVRTLEISGWTWDELGNGVAMPFLTLGSCSGLCGLMKVRMDTKLFDVETANALLDLLARGLIDLNRPGGQGVLRLMSDNENLDEWYGIMMRDAVAPGEAVRHVRAAAATGGLVTADGANTTPRGAWPGMGAASALMAAPHTPAPLGNELALLTGTPGSAAPGGATPYTPSFVDTDMSNEALESHHMVVVMVVLVTCPHLKRLRLDGNKLGNAGAELLSLGLARNSTLRELSLARNSILAAGAKKLGRALEANAVLHRLDLSGQRFEGLGPAGAEVLAAALRRNASLEELNLSSNSIGAQGAKALTDALRDAGPRGGLKRLAVALNGIDSGTARTLQAVAQDLGIALSV